jgi:hypothetical protein
VPSPRQKVEADALVPLFKLVTGKLPVTLVARFTTLVNPSAPIFNVYCWYVVVGPVTDPLVVHVVPFGDVCTFKVHAVVLLLLLYQKDITPGLATKGNLIQSPTPLNVKFVVPVLIGVVLATIEFAVQVPLCVGREVEKLSYM